MINWAAEMKTMKNTLFYEDFKKSEERGILIGEDKKEFHLRIHIIKNLLGKISNSDLAKSLNFSEEELEEFIKENNLSHSSI